MKRIYLTWTLLGIATSNLQAVKRADPPLSRVRVDITGYYGDSVDLAAGVLYNKSRKVEIHQGEVLKIPAGEYTAEVLVPGFQRLISNVTIDQPEQVLSLALPVGSVDGPISTCSIHGSTNVNPTTGRVRVVSLFGNLIEDVPGRTNGTFRFDNLTCGDYLLFGIEKSRCTKAMQVRASLDRRQVVFYNKQKNCIQVKEEGEAKF